MWYDWAGTTTERCIEIPKYFETLKEFDPKTVLDVGFAGGWYHKDVVEMGIKYTGLDAVKSRADGQTMLVSSEKKAEWKDSLRDIEVIPLNIVDWDSPRKFDMVSCISTIEHILAGSYKMMDRGPDADIEAVDKMKTHVKPNGTLFLTFPVGVNCKIGPPNPKKDFAPYTAERIQRVIGNWNIISENYWSDLDAAGEWKSCSKEHATSYEYRVFNSVHSLGIIHLRK